MKGILNKIDIKFVIAILIIVVFASLVYLYDRTTVLNFLKPTVKSSQEKDKKIKNIKQTPKISSITLQPSVVPSNTSASGGNTISNTVNTALTQANTNNWGALDNSIPPVCNSAQVAQLIAIKEKPEEVENTLHKYNMTQISDSQASQNEYTRHREALVVIYQAMEPARIAMNCIWGGNDYPTFTMPY